MIAATLAAIVAALPWLETWWPALLPLLPLSVTAINLLWWRPVRPVHAPEPGLPRVSVLIPARNEAAGIAACVRAIRAADVSSGAEITAEIIVYDDGSTDGTAEIVEALIEEGGARLRLLRGVALPAGWAGKPHACQRLAEAATGEILVFCDADVRLQPGALAALARALSDPARPVDLLTALPRQETPTPVEGWLLPLLHVALLCWLPLPLMDWTRYRRFCAACGQLVAIRRGAWDRIGGYSGVRGSVIEDVALVQAARTAGMTVRFCDASEIAVCRMYSDLPGIWAGFSKNIYPGLGPVNLTVAAALYLGCFVAPFALIPAAPIPALCGAAAGLGARLLLAIRFRQPLWSVPLHPLAVLALCLIALNSLRWSLLGRVRWRGRVYAA